MTTKDKLDACIFAITEMIRKGSSGCFIGATHQYIDWKELIFLLDEERQKEEGAE